MLLLKNSLLLILAVVFSFIIGVIVEVNSKNIGSSSKILTSIDFEIDSELLVNMRSFDFYFEQIDDLLRKTITSNDSATAQNQLFDGIVTEEVVDKNIKRILLSEHIFVEFVEYLSFDASPFRKNINITTGTVILESYVPLSQRGIDRFEKKFIGYIKSTLDKTFEVNRRLFKSKEKVIKRNISDKLNDFESLEKVFDFDTDMQDLDSKIMVFRKKLKENKILRLQSALKFTLENNILKPMFEVKENGFDMISDFNYLYLLGSELLSTIIQEITDSKSYYINRQSLESSQGYYDNRFDLLISYYDIFNKRQFDDFYQDLQLYLSDSKGLVNFEIESFEQLYDPFKRLKTFGVITILFTLMGLLFAITYLNLRKLKL